MAQYYNGVENILKRITKYYNIPLPKTETWHLELFSFFLRSSLFIVTNLI
ncbi:MAG: hypothetical protein AB1298_07565 [Bacteroidota bacterium]